MLQAIGSLTLAAALGAGGSQPARLTAKGEPIPIPPLHGQCQVAFDVAVDERGAVTDARFLYGNPSLAKALEAAVSGWVFEPATEDGEPRSSRVLVAALFRAAAFYALGSCPPPDHSLLAPPGMPIPAKTSPPAYPVQALGRGVVVVEVEVGPSGAVRSARAVGGRTAFDGTAEQAARAWHFLPGRRAGQPVTTLAYLVFGFPEPVVTVRPE
ncbi:MAG: TonB family protein [Acidobacteria bacterium]|nr:TonB family protein [Acidobacteriota bacterium]